MSEDKPTKRPSYIAYQVSEGQGDKSYFNKIGAAFEHKDGEGHNITLESVPVDGRITLRTPKERLEEMRSEPAPQPQEQQAQPQEQQAAPQQDADQGHEK